MTQAAPHSVSSRLPRPHPRPWALLGALSCLLGVACSGAASSAPPRTPAPAPDVADGSRDPSAPPPPQQDDLSLPPADAAVPPPPALCASYGSAPSDVSPAEGGGSCDAAALAQALTAGEGSARTEEARADAALARDRALAALERCPAWPAATLRALRAELAPTECGDVLVEDQLTPGAEGRARELDETLFALGLAARLRRLATHPPEPPEVHDKPTLEAYFQERLFPWIQEQSAAIHQLAERGARLRGYARGVVAVEAGMADMRFVEIARAAPIPQEMQDDPELRTVYYGTLDEALEPRKRRGRDAALAGLAELAEVGVLNDARLTAARTLLSSVYGGRRIDALDRLLLPGLVPMRVTDSVELTLAARVPAFYAPWFLPEPSGTPPEQLLRASLERGLPRHLRDDLRSRPLDDATALLLARGYVELGRAYFRAQDFAEAHRLLEGRGGDEIDFHRALAMALMAGPRNAADMIARGPRFADALGNLGPLDALASSSSYLAGHAAYDAAYLRELVAPEESAAYWQDLAERYTAAAGKLGGDAESEARKRAAAARATSEAITTSQRAR